MSISILPCNKHFSIFKNMDFTYCHCKFVCSKYKLEPILLSLCSN